MPVIHVLGFNTVWFGVVMLIALETGLITPPFGVTLFVMKGIAPPGITMADIWRAVTPYVVIDLLCMALVLALPSLATSIPGLMGMR
jgi:TRAP-type mannitol/chloroaromatic compound transport system permease large subunit